MHLRHWALTSPDVPAVVSTCQNPSISYAELEERSARLASYLHQRGLRPGDTVAVCLDNVAEYLVVTWAAQRSGLYYTSVNRQLTAAEASYIVTDSQARAVVAGSLDDGRRAALSSADIRLAVGPAPPGWQPLETAVSEGPHHACEGDYLGYSSGTTGRPKGIRRGFERRELGDPRVSAVPMLRMLGFEPGARYLGPAPLHHTAPLMFANGVHRLGGTVVLMPRFDAEGFLAAVQEHAITHAQLVPTMLVRLLKLPREVRDRYDTSSLRGVVHAAAPCPVDVKHAMLDWWGPILHEFYGSTEAVGGTWITPEEWLAHPGSVGRPIVGVPHVLDDDGNELPIGTPGTLWFEGGNEFEYHGSPDKTADSRNDKGWATVGDIGYLDDDGYLYLTDRRAHTIIGGGVNVYPREAEDVLVAHPAVLDAAVIGLPDADLGEVPVAVVQLVEGRVDDEALREELLRHCGEHLARYKCPRQLVVVDQLPRQDNGKLYKRVLVEQLG